MQKNINKLFFVAVFIKVSLAVVAILFANIGVYKLSDDSLLFANLNWNGVFEIFFNSDSGWYKVIATNGYKHIPQADLQGWSHPELHFAFFPLYPFCVGAIMKITGLSFYISGFIFNIITLYFVVRYFYLFLIQSKLSESISSRIVILLLLFPFSLHFYFLYTESLFFALLMACFLFMSKKQWWQFSIASGLIVLTRPNGIFLMLPFMLYMLESEGKITVSTIKKALKTASYYSILIMPLVFFLWMVYQKQITGKFFAFKFAQEIGWQKSFVSPFKVLFETNKGLELFISVYCTSFMLISLIMLKKWKSSFQSLIWINLLLPLSAGSLTSMTRYLSILFPYHIVLGTSKFVNKYFRYIAILFILLQLVCFKFWLEDNGLMY